MTVQNAIFNASAFNQSYRRHVLSIVNGMRRANFGLWPNDCCCIRNMLEQSFISHAQALLYFIFQFSVFFFSFFPPIVDPFWALNYRTNFGNISCFEYDELRPTNSMNRRIYSLTLFSFISIEYLLLVYVVFCLFGVIWLFIEL